MARPPPAAQRVRIDGSADSKCLLEAASRTPAVLGPLGISYKSVTGTIRPVGAQLADIGAAALTQLLGVVRFVGPNLERQVDVSNWRLPDRTPQPTAPAANGLADTITTAICAISADALALGQKAAAATTAGGEAWQTAHDALTCARALKEQQQQQARDREEAMRAQHARELEEERAAAAVSHAALEQQLATATAVAIAAKAVAEIATEERPAAAGADVVAAAAAMQCSQTLSCRPHTTGSALGEPVAL